MPRPPTNHTLVLVDYEGQMAFATKNIPIGELRDNVGPAAGGSKIFNVPAEVTTVAEKSFSGPVFPEIKEYYPDEKTYIDRTTMNTWEDTKAYNAIVGKGKKKIVSGGLWPEVCIVVPALSALAEGYEVYVLTGASGGVSNEVHLMAMQRLIQVGVQPITATQYVLELQRDRARQEIYAAVTFTGYFAVHWQDSLPEKGMPYMYSVAYLLLLALGSGRYSLDYLIHRSLKTRL